VRGLFWVILLAALAVAVTLGAHYHSGYVVLVVHPYRVELSLNLLLAVLVLVFVAGYFLIRIVARALGLSSEVRRYRERRRGERAQRILGEALRAFFEGRFAKAEKAATKLVETREFAGLAGVIAARAAHGLRAYDRRDGYLARASYYADDDQTMRTMAQAELLLQGRDHTQALTALERLPHKHTAALRLELKAVQQSRNWDRYLELLTQLARAHALEEGQVEELRRYAIAQNLGRKARDAAELSGYWQRLGRADRRDPVIAAAAARAFALIGNCREAHAVLEASIEDHWDSALVAIYADCPGADTLRQIERAEKWLVVHPDDATLLLTLGRLCMRQQLWGKAKSYFEASLSLEQGYSGHMQFAHLLEQIGEADAARDHYRKSLDLAATELRGSGGAAAVKDAPQSISTPNAV
jgi:HemY protein